MLRYLIDSHNVTDYNRSQEDLQAFWLFGILVAGKNSVVQAEKLAQFLVPAVGFDETPFNYIERLFRCGALRDMMEYHKLGQYTRIFKSFSQSIGLDLEFCTIADLESIHGVGPKTSRFFMLHTRSSQQYAVLDTHILKWMGKELGVDVPKSTPSGERYRLLEDIFLDYCAQRNLSPAEVDLEIWSDSSSNGNRA
jgi:hypothetical protein